MVPWVMITALVLAACFSSDEREPEPPPSTSCTVGWTATDLAFDPYAWLAWEGDVAYGMASSGRIARLDAEGWEQIEDPMSVPDDDGIEDWVNFRDAAWAPDGTIWAIHSWELWHWDGTWSAVAEVQLAVNDLIVRATGEVVLVGTDACSDCHDPPTYVWTWNGGGFDVVELDLTAQAGQAVAETSDGRLVLVGSGGLVAVEDGAGFTIVDSGSDAYLTAVDSDGPGIVAAGRDGIVVRGELDALEVETLGPDEARQVEVVDGTAWVVAGTTLWVDEGGGWAEVPLSMEPIRVAARTPDDVLVTAADDDAAYLRGDAGGFEEVDRQPGMSGNADLWVDDDGVAWITDYSGRLLRWDGAVLETMARNEDLGSADLDGASPDDVVLVDGALVAEWDGSTLTQTVLDETWSLFTVTVSAAGAWAVGTRQGGGGEEDSGPAVLSRGDAGWSDLPIEVPGSRYLTAAWASDDGVLFVLAEGDDTSTFLSWDGTSWSILAELDDEYAGLEGRAEDDVYLFEGSGGEGGLLRWNGTAIEDLGITARVVGVALVGDAVLATTFDYDGGGSQVVVVEGAGPWTSLEDQELLRTEGGGDEVVLLGDQLGWRWEDCE
jgi:hypothetical protein